MYVCSCRVVTDRAVKTAINAGARSIEEIAELCSAGSGCRGCWPELAKLLADRPKVDAR
jgi:bacterioferritin-associated ferredoxin